MNGFLYFFGWLRMQLDFPANNGCRENREKPKAALVHFLCSPLV